MTPPPEAQAVDAAMQRALWLAAVLVAVALSCALMPADDGLRHVGLAFGVARSWGEVYPLSGFSLARDFDPWGGYDALLRILALACSRVSSDTLAAKLLLLKVMVFGCIMAMLGLCIRRARISEALRRPSDVLLVFVVAGVVLAQPVLRAATARPFLFGSLLLVYCVGRRGFAHGALAALVPLVMYPYLAFMFTGPVAVAHFFRGDRRFAYGTALATVASFVMLPPSWWTLLQEVMRSGSVRARLHMGITEFVPATSQVGLVACFVLGLCLVLPRRDQDAPRLRLEHVMMLLFLPVALKHVRYFIDVELPLAFVAHGRHAVVLTGEAFTAMGLRLGAFVGADRIAAAEAAPQAAVQSTVASRNRSGRTRMRVMLAMACAACVLLLAELTSRQRSTLEQMQASLGALPRSARVLTEFNLQYQTLLLRPDLSLIPSCELGLPVRDIEAAYVAYLNEGKVCTLARAAGMGYFLEQRRMYLDPRDTRCLSLVTESERLRVWRVTP